MVRQEDRHCNFDSAPNNSKIHVYVLFVQDKEAFL